MKKDIDYLNIDGENVKINIRSIKRSRSIKIYIKGGEIQLNKPIFISKHKALSVLNENIDKVISMYRKTKILCFSDVITGDKDFLYKGKLSKICLVKYDKKSVKVEEYENTIFVYINEFNEEKIKKSLIKYFKNELENVLIDKLEYYSSLMKLKYSDYSVKKMNTRFGSCNTKTKKLNFNINLILMPEIVMDSIIVHELCHIKYGNHGKDFYEMVYKYSPNYKECQKWIKQNSIYLDLLK